MAPVKSLTKPSSRRASSALHVPAARPGGAASIETLEGSVLAALKAAQRQRQRSPSRKGQAPELLAESTVRMRPRGEPDRRFILSYAVDPDDAQALIFRIRPASARELGPEQPAMMTTQEAADRLNVSRPYIVKLVEDGAFQGVERTRAGHRRIPAEEVERVRAHMQDSRRTALNRMESATVDLRKRELEDARAASKRRWVKAGG